jgi:hypothetical protein
MPAIMLTFVDSAHVGRNKFRASLRRLWPQLGQSDRTQFGQSDRWCDALFEELIGLFVELWGFFEELRPLICGAPLLLLPSSDGGSLILT